MDSDTGMDFIGGENPQSTNVVPVIQYTVYKTQVKMYLNNKGIISPVDFDRVEYDATNQSTEMLPDPYRM